jgi:XTP/dITP diphosphohydrolase/tetrapyrrole methylase family protein/MazG family protein/ATP diphosphatase
VGEPDLAAALTRLDEITRRLRRDCPWDREQDERSIVPHTVEEAYELADAAHSGDDAKLVDELGDVLFQVYFWRSCSRSAARAAWPRWPSTCARS